MGSHLFFIMDHGGIITWLLGAVVGLLALYNKHLTSRLEKAETAIADLHNVYARRDDVKEGFAEINRTLERMENRLYGKTNS